MFNSLSGDSSGIASQLFQFASQTNAGNIDWAQLAQQWIAQNSQSSKDLNEDVAPPPPPNISGNQNNGRRANRNFTRFETEEKGEADMEMDEMDNEDVPPPPPMLAFSGNTSVDVQHNAQWFTPQSGNLDPMSSWNSWSNASNTINKSNPTAHIPSLMKISVPNPNESSKGDDDTHVAASVATLDAAKRKVLPAWIREGLEKMEREKQKQIEREQQLKGRDHTTSELGLKNEHDTVKSKFQASDHDDSSDSEQTLMDDRLNRPISNETRKFKEHASTSAQVQSDDGEELADCDEAAETNVTVTASFGKSYEQKLADLMITVRRTLTELLLDVTNDEISHIAQETLNSRKLKASSAQVVRKSALSSITNKLGLAAYSSSGESDSENSAASDNERRRRASSVNTAGDDSEEEIKSNLRLRRRAFAKVSEEIEDRIAANAAREEQKLKFYKQKEQQKLQKYLDNDDSEEESDGEGDGIGQSHQHRSLKNVTNSEKDEMGKNYARNFGETTTDSKLQSSNGKRSRERGRRGERTTRFSDNKDTKNISAVTASYITQLAAASNKTSTAMTTTAIPQYSITSGSSAHTVPDTMAKLQNFYPPTSATAVGINTMMNAADAALEKAAKSKSSSSKRSTTTRSRYDGDYDEDDGDDVRSDHRGDLDRERHRRRHDDSRRHTSDESDSSTNSRDSSDSSNSSHSSRHSKYSRASSNSYSRRKHSSGRSSRHDDYKRYHSGHNRYDDRYHRHSSSSKSSKYSTERATSSSSKRKRHDRERSRSRSTYSSSSSKRHRH